MSETSLWIALLTAISAAFGWLKAYYEHRKKLIDQKEKADQRIESLRRETEETKSQNIQNHIHKFEQAVAILRQEGIATRNRMDTLQNELQSLQSKSIKLDEITKRLEQIYEKQKTHASVKIPIGSEKVLVTSRKENQG